MEIIQAIRQPSNPTLLATPTGVLSIIAHYSRPNVYAFSNFDKVCTMRMYHYTVEGSTIGSHPSRLHIIQDVIGAIGDNIYLDGYDKVSGWMIYSFSLQTHAFKGLWSTEGPSFKCLLSTESLYMFDIEPSFCRCDLITGGKIELPSMIDSEDNDPHYFLYNDTIYVSGEHCQRFDIKENKWYKMPPLPVPAKVVATTVKDGHLYLITAGGDFFMYNPEKDTWMTLKVDIIIALLSIEKLHYSEGRFTVVSKTDTSMTVWESTVPEEPWKAILRIEGNHHLHLTINYHHVVHSFFEIFFYIHSGNWKYIFHLHLKQLNNITPVESIHPGAGNVPFHLPQHAER